MTKRYYIDENGLIVGEIPPEVLTPTVDLSATTPHVRQMDINDKKQKREKTKKSDVITWLRKPEKKFVACPICQAKIISSKFRKHLKKDHNKSSVEQKKKKKSRSVHAISIPMGGQPPRRKR